MFYENIFSNLYIHDEGVFILVLILKGKVELVFRLRLAWTKGGVGCRDIFSVSISNVLFSTRFYSEAVVSSETHGFVELCQAVVSSSFLY